MSGRVGETSPGEFTQLLEAWSAGDQAALEALVPLAYKELRRMAHRYMRLEQRGRGFQTTELINEVYLRLVDTSRVRWRDRAHFLAVSAQLMRRILVDFARSRRYSKRGGDAIRVTFEAALQASDQRPAEWEAIDDALLSLEALDARKGKVVELRFFGGLSLEETAEVLGVSVITVRRDWEFARTWLSRELVRKQSSAGGTA